MLAPRGLGKGVTVAAITILLVGWVVMLPPAGAKGSFVTYDASAHRFTVSPTGIDDTANIQAAFDGCAADGSRCTIQLTSGTFYTAQIVAWNFQGSFQGMGAGKTAVQALPNLPVSKDHPFSLHLPSADNPWPNLFTFFDGTYSISGITFVEPYEKPTQTYWAHDTFGKADALFAVISVTGLRADVTLDHVTLIGAAGDFSAGGPSHFNVVQGIFPQALILQPGSKGDGSAIPLQVAFEATNSAFFTIDDPIGFEGLVNSTVTVSSNMFDTGEWAVAFGGISLTTATVSQNRARNLDWEAGVWAEQYSLSTLMPCMLPSELTVTHNDFAVTGGGVGVLGYDFGPWTGCGESLDMVVAGNTIRRDATARFGVYTENMRSTVVSGNSILGPGTMGVLLAGETAGVIVGNEIRGSAIGILLPGATGMLVQANLVTESAQWGIAVIRYPRGPLSNNNLIEQNVVSNSGQFDLFWDGTGTGNEWTGNVFQTEYPPGLNT